MGVFAPVVGGGVLASADGAAWMAGFGAAVAEGFVNATYAGTYNYYISLGADAATAAAAAAAAAAGVVADGSAAAYGAQQTGIAAADFMTLMGTAIPSIANLVLGPDLNVVDPDVEFGDYAVTKETTWTQTEIGYKGQISDNMTLAVDVYKLNIADYVSGLSQISGYTIMAADGGSYVAALLTAMYGNDNLTNFVSALDANGAYGGADELAALIAGQVALPTGSIAPSQSPYGGNIVVGYKQLTEDLNLNGLEATLNYFPTNDWNFYINMSLLSDSSLTGKDGAGRSSDINMNTPEFKLGGGMQYAGESSSYGMSLRYQGSHIATGFASTSGEIPSFYTLGVNGKWNIDGLDGMSIGLSIDNITDVVHRETYLGPAMGRFTTLSVGYDL